MEDNDGLRFLRKSTGGAFVSLGGAMITSYGLVGLTTSNFLGGLTQLGTGDYLSLWSLTYLVIVLGLLTIFGGVLVASDGEWKRLGGVSLGFLGSIIGMLLALGLLTTVIRLSSGVVNSLTQTALSAQFLTTYEIQLIGFMAVAFVGFPLAIFGTMAGLFDSYHEPAEKKEPTENPEK